MCVYVHSVIGREKWFWRCSSNLAEVITFKNLCSSSNFLMNFSVFYAWTEVWAWEDLNMWIIPLIWAVPFTLTGLLTCVKLHTLEDLFNALIMKMSWDSWPVKINKQSLYTVICNIPILTLAFWPGKAENWAIEGCN